MLALSSLQPLTSPCSLTIGTFDGIHLGHQALLQQLPSPSVVITFSPPPGALLRNIPIPLLTSLPHKLHLLQQWGIHTTFCLPFTQELSQEPFDTFLNTLHQYIPFTTLLLGANSTFGKNREGTPDQVLSWGQSHHITISYLPKIIHSSQEISSTLIRTLIQQGDLPTAAALLGRPYSLYLPFSSTLHTPDLCLPPNGTYPILIHTTPAFAHIRAPYIDITSTEPLPQPGTPAEFLF